MILLIDNYDSFTWNLVHRLGEVDPTLRIDEDLIVKRHDEITPDQAAALDDGRGPSHAGLPARTPTTHEHQPYSSL